MNREDGKKKKKHAVKADWQILLGEKYISWGGGGEGGRGGGGGTAI